MKPNWNNRGGSISDSFDSERVNAIDVKISDGLTFRFPFQNGRYVYTLPFKSHNEDVLVSTGHENIKRYSKREVEAAELAKATMANLGYPSTKIFIDMIKASTISDIPVTAQDVNTLKRKTFLKKNAAVDIEYVATPIDQNITLFADIMFVQGDPYLITVRKELGLTMANSLKCRGTAAVKEALGKQLSSYTSTGFVVRTLLTDGEKERSMLALHG